MYAYSIRLHTHTYIYIYTRTLYTCITNYTITYTGKCEPPKSWKPKRTCGKNIRSSCVVDASSSLSLSLAAMRSPCRIMLRMSPWRWFMSLLVGWLGLWITVVFSEHRVPPNLMVDHHSHIFPPLSGTPMSCEAPFLPVPAACRSFCSCPARAGRSALATKDILRSRLSSTYTMGN